MLDIFTHHSHRHLVPGIDGAVHDFAPVVEVRRSGLKPEAFNDDVVQTLFVKHGRDIVNTVPRIQCGDHRLDWNISKHADFCALGFRQFDFRTAEQYIGLYADRPQLLDRVLRRLGLDLIGSPQERYQGKMYEHGFTTVLNTQLPDGLKEW